MTTLKYWLTRILPEGLDEVGHRLGWTPRWLCDMAERSFTGWSKEELKAHDKEMHE